MLANIYLGIKDAAKCKINLINTIGNKLPVTEYSKANKESDAIILLGEYDAEETEFDLQVPGVGVFMNNSINGKFIISWD